MEGRQDLKETNETFCGQPWAKEEGHRILGGWQLDGWLAQQMVQGPKSNLTLCDTYFQEPPQGGSIIMD